MFHKGFDSHVNDIFPTTKTLIFNNCDKNFVYYNVSSRKFPVLETIISNSHPCDWDVLRRFKDNPDYEAYLIDKYYSKYENRWYKFDTYIKSISPDKYEKMIGVYEKEEPEFLK